MFWSILYSVWWKITWLCGQQQGVTVITQLENFFGKLNSLYSSIKNNVHCTNVIMDAKKYLRQIPQMDYVFAKLPYNLSYTIKSDVWGQFSSNGWFNQIAVNPTLVSDDYYKYSGHKMLLMTTLSHELCHANQQACGLSAYNLQNTSFGDVFRVYKMTEIETALLEAVIEHELVKKTEFKDFDISSGLGFLYYYCLDKENGDIQKAKRDFVLLCWTNSYNKIQTSNTRLKSICQNVIQHWYTSYTKDAIQCALKQKFTQKNAYTPIQVIDACLQRTGLNGVIKPEFFLQNGSDNAKTDNRKRTVTLLTQSGKKYCKYRMRSNELKVTWFKNQDTRILHTMLKNTDKQK